MISKLRSAFVGLLVIAASTVAVTVSNSPVSATGNVAPSAVASNPSIGAQNVPTWSNTNIIAVDAGSKGTCAIQGANANATNGVLFCWGYFTVLGTASQSDSNVAVRVVPGNGFSNTAVTAVAVGEDHACAVEGGMVWCWGTGSNGKLGNGASANSLTPVKVSANAGDGFDNDGASGDAVTAIDASYQRSCVIEGGAVFCWGDNSNTALGLGSNAASSFNTPQRVADTATPEFRAASAIQLALGFYGGCAVASGSAYCWGLDGVRLGNPAASQGVPLKVVQGSFSTSGSNVTFIGSGANHSCGIESGVLHCWGKGTDYKLGSGNTSDSSAPVQVVPGGGLLNSGDVTAMTGGEKHTCVIEAGKLFCWGGNSAGQIGNGTATSASAPIAVSVSDVAGFDNDGAAGDAVTSVTSSASLGTHTCAIEGGVVYCWGENMNGQLGLGQLQGPAPKKPTKVFVVSAPGAPTISVSAGQSGTLNVSVTKPSDGGSTILSYEYSVNDGSPTSVTSSGDNTESLSVTGLINDTSYSIKVRAVNAIGAGGWSAPSSGTPRGSSGSNPSNPSTPCVVGAPTSTNSAVTFDTSFGSGGSLSMGDSSNSVGPATGTVTRSGQILVAASASMTASPFTVSVRLVRYNVDGSLDTSFGTNGIGGFNVPSMQNIGPSFVTELSDGSIVVAGTNNSFGVNQTVSAVVMKFSSNGTLDTSFGTNGILTLDSASSPGVVSPTQMIPVGDSMLVMYIRSSGSTSTKIAKISSTGSLDSSFGTSGTLTLSGSGADLAPGSSGAFFVAGTSSAATPDATVSKYSSTGSLDTSFGTSGVATVDTSTSRETGVSAVVVNGKIMVGVKVTTSASGQASSLSAKLVRLNADGSVDSGYGTSGVATVYSGTAALVRAKFTSNGTGILTFANSSVVFVAADGTPLAGSATTPINASGGACVASKFDLLPVGSSVFFVATNYPPSGMGVTKSWVMKASVAGVDLTAGGSTTDGGSNPGSGSSTESSTPAPTLVTSANAAALVRAPGAQAIIINGEEVVIESKTVSIPASRTPAAQRTPAQVASIQQAGAALLQQFLASLPAGATSNVTVVNTATGAVMQNLVFDANGNSVNVPVEDIVFLDGPQLSLMIGSNNANITADGKYQVGAGGIVGVTGSGLGVSANGEIIAMSTPTLLANFQTTAAGDFNKSATLPESIGVGDHTLVVATGTTYAMMGIRVVPAALPTTGNSSDRVVIIALFTLVFGALFFRGRRISLI